MPVIEFLAKGPQLAVLELADLDRAPAIGGPDNSGVHQLQDRPFAEGVRNDLGPAAMLHLGIAIWVNSPWLVATLMVAVAVMAIVVIPREERYLQGRFGTEYLNCKASARRWL
jgi:hypothetical protein